MNKANRLRAIDQQIARLTRELAQLRQRSGRLGWLRVAAFGLLVVGSAAALYGSGPWLAAVLFLLLAALFALLVIIHGRVDEAITRRILWRRWKQIQVARAMLDWSQIPLATEAQPDYAHPFEADLDVVAERPEDISLHRLLDVATTLGGSRRLRQWLTATEVDMEAVLARQLLARELVSRSWLRSRLFVDAKWAEVGEDAAGAETAAESKLDTDSLLAWLADTSSDKHLQTWLVGLGGLLLVTWGLLAFGLLNVTPLWYGLVSFGAYWVLLFGSPHDAASLFGEATRLRDQLNHFSRTFRLLERFSYRDTPRLRGLCTPFLNSKQRPSRYLGRVSTVVNAAGVRGNPLVWFVLNSIVPWDHLVLYRLQTLKGLLAKQMPQWLNIWFELEASMSLANYGYLNPRAAFPCVNRRTPSLDGGTNSPAFEAKQLGHPLLPELPNAKVRNDFLIHHPGDMAILTGSNMSGKSTFLRTVGVNLVLAYAGAPVDALTLHTLPFRLFTTMKVSDSVADGISYFYAEVRRLRQLLTAVDASHPQPLFFLIDEIFRGTNNRERLIGSRSFIKELAGRSAVGLISTHDLELIGLADALPQVRNFHFRDDVRERRMIFDYLLREGPSPTTNALTIMRQEGLPVEDDGG